VQRFLITRDKPPDSAATSFSSGQHADMGILTLGPVSTHPALEIIDCTSGTVINAEAGLSASLGDCVLLAGETLSFLTGGAVQAPIHRVPWIERQPDSAPRRSAPFFLRAHPASRLRAPTAALDLSCRELMEMHILSFRPWRLRAADAINVGDW
jgi:isopenicillin N synthase-like dioxygenase